MNYVRIKHCPELFLLEMGQTPSLKSSRSCPKMNIYLPYDDTIISKRVNRVKLQFHSELSLSQSLKPASLRHSSVIKLFLKKP